MSFRLSVLTILLASNFSISCGPDRIADPKDDLERIVNSTFVDFRFTNRS